MKKSSWIIIILSMLLMTFLIYSVVQKIEVSNLREMAIAQESELKKITRKERERAKELELLAKQHQEIAQAQKVIADSQTELALKNEKKSEEQVKLNNVSTEERNCQEQLVRLSMENQDLSLKNDSLMQRSAEHEERANRYRLAYTHSKAQVKRLREEIEGLQELTDSLRSK